MNYLPNLPVLIAINDPLMISLIIVGGLVFLIAIFLLVYFLFIKKRNKKVVVDNNIWFLALGNKENVKEIRGIGSRLTLKLVDKNKIDREKLKELGVTSILTMSDKVTLVIEGQAEKLSSLLNNNL